VANVNGQYIPLEFYTGPFPHGNVDGQFLELGLPPPDVDSTAPVIGNFSPAQGSQIDANQSIYFEVTDTSGTFRRIIVHAVFEDGIEEVVHDGSSFRGRYQVGNTRVIITNGWAYTLLRYGGWPSSPTIRIFAIDAAGNERTA
jgi:hypothetical protein